MPLHLLGKKSWNVYNSDNIARVQRDEADARARDEEEERRMQEADAEHRLNLLRGANPSRIENAASRPSHTAPPAEGTHKRKRRRIAGEDDTDRELREARENAEVSLQATQVMSRKAVDESIVDHEGHINLFPQAQTRRSAKNEEAEADAAKKKKEFEDQYTMRFSNAAGNKSGSDKPWYTNTSAPDLPASEVVSKDVWGNEDPGRRQREQKRADTNDPLAAMKQGVKQLREAEKHRKEWMEQRERDLNEVEELARKRRRHRRRRSREGSLDDFNLDDNSESAKKNRDPQRSGDRHLHHHRSHSGRRDHERDRERSRRHASRRSRSPKAAG